MEPISAAAGSAATVVQLIDFTGTLLQKTTNFLSALKDASKELEALHRKIDALSSILDNTRKVAVQYQNSTLGADAENQRTLELVGKALTSCAIDVQELQRVAPERVSEGQNFFVRSGRRVQSVLDKDRINKISQRLEGHVAFIGGLLSCLHVHNDAISQQSLERIQETIYTLPAATNNIAILTTESRQAFITVENTLRGLSTDLQHIDQTIAEGAANIGTRLRQLEAAAHPMQLDDVVDAGSFNMAMTDCDLFLQALDVLGPLARRAFTELYSAEQLPFNTESISWVLAELHSLLAMVHAAAADAYKEIPKPSSKPDVASSEDVVLPRRFRNSVELRNAYPLVAAQPSFDSSSIVPSRRDANAFKHTTSRYEYSDPSGKLLFAIDTAPPERRHSTRPGDATFPSPEEDPVHVFLRVSFNFIPAKNYLPGLSFASCRHTNTFEDGDCRQAVSMMTAFQVLSNSAPIIRDIKDGDLGVARALRRLKQGEAWAGDRDHDGKSLLTYAIESRSRDMVTLLSRMGADIQDVHSMSELDIARFPSQLTHGSP